MPIRRLGPADLAVFIAVAESGSFRAAADRLGMSQPAVSVRIQRLESLVGLRLFSRSTRRVLLTDAGDRLLHQASKTVHDLQRLMRDFQDEAELKVGRVVIGASQTLSAAVLPQVIREFMASHPNVRVQMDDVRWGNAPDGLLGGGIDLAFAAVDSASLAVHCEPLFKEELVVVVDASTRLPVRPTMRLEELAELPFITVRPRTPVSGQLRQALAAAGREFVTVFEANSVLALVGMVRAGVGLAVVSRPMLSLVASLVEIKVEGLSLHREVGLMTVPGRTLSPAAEAFAAVARRVLKDAQGA